MGKYCIDRMLSDASYGEVLLGHDVSTDELVAIKKMDPATAVHGCKCPRVREDIEVEKHVNRLFRSHGGHPNILPLRQDFVQNGADHLVFDFCPKGDLFTAMDHGALPNDVAQRYFSQIAHGIAFMHANGVAHRDVSLENVLIDDSDTCRVCDFGLAASTKARDSCTTPLSQTCGRSALCCL
ncbi:serine/threonine protein kinase [Aphanomyces invadans]|uniref:Serine/threonine protein kinase n=1 Tax=Aphanomyces invadans TaxID=157072 RepID=A0A024TWN4_9STRA|nr:serine/threonine protein kinase [Aphanomyces invadans]ETV98384.1 serine/threonine protein kinase [Aphanomyces invadans]|eukprot:XP_008873259.1 serine/threonine protein kinase [Aphanomyces invadans]